MGHRVGVHHGMVHRLHGIGWNQAFLIGRQLFSFPRAAMLPQEQRWKETQALDCWSTHCILHLVLPLPTGMNSQGWCQGVNASEAWVKQDSCLCLNNHLPARSEL